jgi:LuxR family transcriptional regulator, maltose regulon positive regulatory protein
MSALAWHSRQPPARVPQVRRAHLLRRLGTLVDEAGPRIALLSAPAGFGKTTLLTQFCDEVAAEGDAVAWADLEIAGTSTAAMWRAILSALSDSSREAAAAMDGMPRVQRSSDGRFLERFLHALAELTAPTFLVIDDVQLLTQPQPLDQLRILARRLPPSVRLVLSSRHDGGLPLHESRLTGNLVEIRAGELAFTPSETNELLSEEGLDNDDDIRAVIELTEGWPAGVQLARGLLNEPGDGRRLTTLFNAQAGILADYLFQEAFTVQEPQAQDLLLRTSTVPEMSDGLATALTGRPDAGEAIADMTDIAPLLSRYGDHAAREVRYRYHPLLRSYLVSELARRDQELLLATHRSAAAWYERHGEPIRAIRHAKASQDVDLLDDFLRRYAAALIVAGDSESLLDVLRETNLAPTGWEVAIAASSALRCRDPVGAAQWLAHPNAVADPADPRLRRLRASIQLVLAGLNATYDAGTVSEPESEDPPSVDDLELLIALNRSVAQIAVGDSVTLERDLGTARDLATALGRPTAELQARILGAAAAVGQGAFVTAAVRESSARVYAAERGDVEEPSAGLLDVVDGWIAYERLDDESARRCLDAWQADRGHTMEPATALAARRYAGLLEVVVDPALGLTVGELSGVRKLATGLPPALQVIASFMTLRAALTIGRPDAVRQSVDQATQLLGNCGDVMAMRALALTAQHRGDLAHRLLQPHLADPASWRTPTALVEGLVMSATYAIQSDHAYEAFSSLEQALATAQESGSYRPLGHASPEVHALLAEQIDRLSAYRDVVDTVLAYAYDSTSVPNQPSPLTARELDILRELPTLDRVDEIAANLLISTNTVKTHIRGIYSKLGVRSRKEAVAIARKRGIL